MINIIKKQFSLFLLRRFLKKNHWEKISNDSNFYYKDKRHVLITSEFINLAETSDYKHTELDVPVDFFYGWKTETVSKHLNHYFSVLSVKHDLNTCTYLV